METVMPASVESTGSIVTSCASAAAYVASAAPTAWMKGCMLLMLVNPNITIDANASTRAINPS